MVRVIKSYWWCRCLKTSCIKFDTFGVTCLHIQPAESKLTGRQASVFDNFWNPKLLATSVSPTEFSQSWCPWVENETCCNVVFQIVKHRTLIMENALLYLGSGLLRVEILESELSNWIWLLVTVRLFACPWKWENLTVFWTCVCYLFLFMSSPFLTYRSGS